MITQAESIFKDRKFEGKSLYLAMANNGISEGMDLKTVMQDTTDNAVNARPLLLFSNLLKERNPNGLRSMFHFYPDDNHGSVTMIATYDAFRFFFKTYTLPASVHFKIPEPSFKADSAIIKHFKTASEQMGYNVLPPESFVNETAFNMMYSDDMDRAFKLFELNVRNYPKSFNVYDSMGDYYVAMNDKENAKKHFTKALELKEVESIRKKLEKLITE